MERFSIIIPVFNRPDEVSELLESLSKQTDKGFEVLVIEDGSSVPCEEVCKQYEKALDLKYYFKPNSGRSETRNYGIERATGDWFIIYDSDVIVPPQYIATVRAELAKQPEVDCYGGPDAADASFSDVQKAINYSMTSIMTTGGIRGATKNKSKFSPRSFNMGISRKCFETVGGYKNMIGEDIDLSIRIQQAGFKTTLIPEAYVYHKRRVDLKKFFRQVNTFGKGRVLLGEMHPGSTKLVHLLPAAFVLGHVGLVLAALVLLVISLQLSAFSPWWSLLVLAPIGLYVLGIFTESLVKNKSIKIACLSIIAAYMQLFGYGTGFLGECLTHKARKKKQEELYK
ncbi:MAG: glycosyltransferase [Paludibacteraceae bacterium]|nr:glycosyltransferase [Paludibacteraceae bacterium]